MELFTHHIQNTQNEQQEDTKASYYSQRTKHNSYDNTWL